MTPTEQWMMGLALVYSVPSFFGGVGITLLFVRWEEIRRAVMIPRFLSPELVFEQHQAISLAPTDDSLLPDGLR